MAPPARRTYGGKSAADRQAERRARLLEAGLDAIGGEGWAATTVRGVCERARLTPRYFYEQFADLDALAVAVFDEAFARTTASVVAAIAAAPDAIESRVRAAIEAAFRDLTDDPRRARLLFAEAYATGPLAARRIERLRDVIALIGSYGREAFDVTAEAEPLLQVTATMLAGGLAETVGAWLRDDLPLEREALIDDLVALFVAGGRSAEAIARARAAGR
ncbi:TetR/AcrR family transcriptional regulator [Patulibacter defluvii]|uniref:TetR/AcrR family transcriptional regulator n=1 Tax=Patulibacter defluvii TaxID=3095358 RepID=UPI002A7504EC|nr:TetR family transcriptional regulator [Patulibacter sp. DM4]